MSWFLVLLFWNPWMQEWQPLDWQAIPHASYESCDQRLQYIEQYMLESEGSLADCIQAKDAETAINILKR